MREVNTRPSEFAINMDEELPPAYKILLERFSSGELSYVDVINDLHHPNSNVFVPKMKAYMNAITESRSNIGIDLDEIERMHTYDQLKRQASNIRQELKEQKRQNEELTIMKDLVMIRNKAGSSCHNKMSTAQYNNTSKFESVSINNNKNNVVRMERAPTIPLKLSSNHAQVNDRSGCRRQTLDDDDSSLVLEDDAVIDCCLFPLIKKEY